MGVQVAGGEEEDGGGAEGEWGALKMKGGVGSCVRERRKKMVLGLCLSWVAESGERVLQTSRGVGRPSESCFRAWEAEKKAVVSGAFFRNGQVKRGRT